MPLNLYMQRLIWLETLLPTVGSDETKQLTLFSIVNLGVIQSIQGGLLAPSDALGVIYHAQNCSYIHTKFPDSAADIIMSHGIQLPDLFDILPPELAQRNLYHQLEEMRALCFNLLEKEPMAA